jgi:hypothetical protein
VGDNADAGTQDAPDRGITLYGECRDVTTTQNTMNEPVPPAELQ